MQNAASLPADRFDGLLRRLPVGLDLDGLARRTKAIERKREIGTGANLLRPALARGPGRLSLGRTAAWATVPGLAGTSGPAVEKRLGKAAGLLGAAMARQLAGKAPGAAVRWAGRTLRLCGGSGFREPGAKTASWRLHAVHHPGRGGFPRLALADGHGGGAIEQGAPLPGGMRIGDRGFARAPSLRRFREQSADKADSIVRAGWAAFGLTAHPGQLPVGDVPHEAAVRARAGPPDPALPLRPAIRRKAPGAARAKLRREASKKQKAPGPRSLTAAESVILGASLPAEGCPAEEALAAHRLRWQIEPAFKRLKSLLGTDRLPTRTERASRSWLTAHPIMALSCGGTGQELLESPP